MKSFKNIVKAILISCLAVSGTQALAARDLSSTDQTAKIYAVTASWNTNILIEQLDGHKTKISGKKPTLVDAGERHLDVRMEYQPAAGSALLVGTIGNLLLRGATNKTFRTQLEINMAQDHEYAVYVENNDNKGFDLITFDLTNEQELARQSFAIKQGKLERLF